VVRQQGLLALVKRRLRSRRSSRVLQWVLLQLSSWSSRQALHLSSSQMLLLLQGMQQLRLLLVLLLLQQRVVLVAAAAALQQ
jgi:TctA family transporter